MLDDTVVGNRLGRLQHIVIIEHFSERHGQAREEGDDSTCGGRFFERRDCRERDAPCCHR